MDENNNDIRNDGELKLTPYSMDDSSMLYNVITEQIIIEVYKRFGIDYTSLLEYWRHGHISPYLYNLQNPVNDSAQGDIIHEKRDELLPDRRCRNGVVDEHDTQNKLCSSVYRKRRLTTSDSLDDHQNKKENQIDYFSDKYVNLSTHWHLYKINISEIGVLGFVVPCELIKVPKFYLYDGDHKLIVHVVYVGAITYKECENQLKDFCQFIFEDFFDDMNTGPKSFLKFDIEHSSFKLLPCLLNESDGIYLERMAAICNRKNKIIQNSSELIDNEWTKKRFYLDMMAAPLLKQCINMPNLNYHKHKDSSSTTNKKSNASPNQSHRFSIADLRYAPLNQTDIELIYKLPTILFRISQLLDIEQLRKLLADNIECYPLLDVDEFPIVNFDDCLTNYDVLLGNKFVHQPSPGLLFQAITQRSAEENTNMKSLATLGDSYLKLEISMSLYHQYPLDKVGQLTSKKDKQVSNENLYRLAMEMNLKKYLYANKVVYTGNEANWIPPGFTVNEERYNKQKAKRKAFADLMEALIGALLISTDYMTTIQFMKWLGLDVIPMNEQTCRMKAPSVLQMDTINNIDKRNIEIQRLYDEYSFTEIENKINYNFKDKAYLIAAFTHSSYSNKDFKINYKRSKFIGNAVLEFLVTRCIFITKNSITPGDVTDIRRDLVNKNRQGHILVKNQLHKKILCKNPEINKHIQEILINENNIDQWEDITTPDAFADVSYALFGAVFLDSGRSLKITWDVIYLLLLPYIDHSIARPNAKK